MIISRSRPRWGSVVVPFIIGVGILVAVLPLSIPFTVRVPVWRWGFGHDPIAGTRQGIGLLLAAMAGCAVAFLLIRSSVKNVRGLRDQLFAYRET